MAAVILSRNKQLIGHGCGDSEPQQAADWSRLL